MLFDCRPAALPTAKLRPTATQPRHEVASLHVVHWLVSALGWARPRAVPLFAAFLGMIAVLGATRYLLTFSVQCARPAVIGQASPGETPAIAVDRIAVDR
jgi:hypothetical protein